MKNLRRADLDSLSRRVAEERALIRLGLDRLRATSLRDDIEDLDPDALIRIAVSPQVGEIVGTRRFLQWAAARHKHVSLHDYPAHHEQADFRYPPR